MEQRTARRLQAVFSVPVGEIDPGPLQPRRHFSRQGIEELRDSVARYGVLQPLAVRRKGERFELIAGERRLRAAKLAGLDEVPCVVMDVDMEDSGLIALIENVQRRDLDFIEEAEGIRRIIRLFGLSQEETARRLGKSQSAVANKLRLLRLPRETLELLRDGGLGERHARALLRLDTPERQKRAAEEIVAQGMNVAAAERYVDALLAAPEPAEEAETAGAEGRAGGRRVFLMRDVRLFLNALDRSMALMRAGGVRAELRQEETDETLTLTVRIEKK